ncbi:MAG: RNA-binding transcriptional accessory protein [Verrucomicrobia bacterium]|nr:RNA-binding transcriptional accessory protein [Cytophagales bacterium]
MTHFQIIAKELQITENQVNTTVELLEAGGTVPFISRYRKEMTENLDEVQIAAIRDRISQLRELDKRREAILKSIAEQGKLSPELEASIEAAQTLTILEDLYLPYKPKRRTRATIAREKGLEPLALAVYNYEITDLEAFSKNFIDEEKGVKTTDEALAGARDIIAEMINENAEIRSKVRAFFLQTAVVQSRVFPGKEVEAQKFKDYFEMSEAIKNIPSHRMLALRRGENEGFLMLDILPDETDAIQLIESQLAIKQNEAGKQIKTATSDSYKRLMKPSLETDVRLTLKEKADEEAIKVFAENLRELLMAAPLGQKNVLAIDPGFRTGCKIVVLDKQGKLLHNDVIYPEMPHKKALAEQTVLALCAKYAIEAVAVGNGTAGRETEDFIRKLDLPKEILLVMVNESGASVYSASEVAREEFPDYDITVRGAVSIGRRLMDPLAELVKIDPKAIGVGQYQHDVNQNFLQNGLDDVVMSCVNAVGVELNTASKQILTYISGLGKNLAQNIVDYRNQNGAFTKREDLKKVPRMGEKAFEQCAGFLRINASQNPLDSSAVHPESYHIVEKMASDLNCSVADLMKNNDLRKQLVLKNYVTTTVGLPTLQDILLELAKPGRDPRKQFETFAFAEGISDMKDLKIGMKLPGIVTNVTNFGAFVDIGVHQDGLVHISQLADSYISDPKQVVKVQQQVMVTVTEIDLPRKRIALSMKGNGNITKKETAKKPENEADMNEKLAQLKAMFGK